MNKIILKNPNSFSILITGLKQFYNDCNIHFLNDRLQISNFSTCKTSLIKTKLKTKYFEEFKYVKDQIISINLSILCNCLKKIKKNDKVSFTFLEDTILINAENDSRSIEFQMITINLNESIFTFPKIDFNNEIFISSSKFKNLLNDLNLSTTIIFNISDDNLMLKSTNDNINLKVNYKKKNNKFQYKKLKNGTNLEFYIKQLINFSKFMTLTNNFILEFKNNFPLRIFCELIEDNNSTLEIFISPLC